MRLSLRIEAKSPESEFLKSFFGESGEVTELDGWDVRSHTQTYDVAVCIGAVRSCPVAARRILFVLGPTKWHHDLGWDEVIVTSQRAAINITRQFGHGSRVFTCPPPLLEMRAGSRRLMEPQNNSIIHLSSSRPKPEDAVTAHMPIWTPLRKPPVGGAVTIPFSPMEFNSRARHGATGYYGGMDDGYDIQVRRHLAFGSRVECPEDKLVMGDLLDVCNRDIEPVEDEISKSDYRDQLTELLGRL